MVKRNPKTDIVKKVCPKCHHDRMWGSRGLMSPFYNFKCCKCGWRMK